MKPAQSDSPFRVFAYRSKKRTVRFLVSPNVTERIPFLEELLMRAVAGSVKAFVWPPSVVISGQDEWLPIPGESLHVVVPCWLFDRIAEQHTRPLDWKTRIFGYVTVPPLAWDISYILACYLNPLQVAEECRDCQFPIFLSLGMPFEYRPASTTLRAMVLLALLFSILLLALLGPAVFRNNRRLLYARATIQREFGWRKGLSRTRQRLSELGVPQEKLKDFMLSPDLKLVKNDDDKGESE